MIAMAGVGKIRDQIESRPCVDLVEQVVRELLHAIAIRIDASTSECGCHQTTKPGMFRGLEIDNTVSQTRAKVTHSITHAVLAVAHPEPTITHEVDG